MKEEYQFLTNNKTWVLVEPTHHVIVVGNKWVFDSSISRYKDRLVAKGFHQTQGLDYNETFSSFVKSTTISVILSLIMLNH